MKPAVKTLLFVAIACGSTLAAFATHRTFQVDLTRKISDEGEEFFPEFTDPNAATALEVAAYDSNAARVNDFKVEYSDGKWRIPSHNNYPADGKDRLRETAASVIGVRREVQVGESADDHRRHNLLDPLSESVSGSDGRGTRITIKKGDAILVDYIVGKKVENVGQDVYYVRKADEPRYYRANLGKFNISTKFADWIEPDLLQISPSDVKEVSVNRYKIDLTTGEQTEPDISDLSRETAGGDWKLAELDEAKDKVKTSVVTEMINSLDKLEVVGVRRKPEAVAAMLRGEKPKVTQTQMLEVSLDMQSKGFVLQRGIIPVSGSVSVGTFDGIGYDLSFGSVFSGTDVEVEVGKSATPPAASEEKSKPEAAGETKTDVANSDKPADEAKADEPDAETESESDPKAVKNRYVFIQTRFDEKLLGEKPQPPVKPEPPKAEPAQPADAAEAKDAPKVEKTEDATATDAASAEKKEPPAPTTEAPKKPETSPDEAQKKYEQALKDYELENEVYETKKKEYEEKITNGKKRVEQLNARFASWYYVVSEDVYEGLRSRRADLIEPKDPPKVDAAGGIPMTPDIPGLPGFPLPGGKTETPKPEAPATEAASETPADSKPAETKTDAKDEAAPEAKPDAEAKPDVPKVESPPEATGDKPPAEANPAPNP